MTVIKQSDVPEGVKTLFNKGIEALERGNLDYAMDMFESVVHREPAFLEARKQLHQAALKKQATAPESKVSGLKTAAAVFKLAGMIKKNPQQALESSEALLRAAPLNLKLAKAHCDAAIACNMPEVAILTLELLNEQLPDNLSILEPLADLACSCEHYDLEYECRNRISRIKPDDTKALKQLKDAAARLTMGKSGWQHAERFRNVSQNEPAPDPLHSELKAAEEKVKTEPDNRTARQTLAGLYTQKKSYRAAQTVLTEFLEQQHAPDPELEQRILKINELRLSDQLATAEDQNDADRIEKIKNELSALRITNAAALAEHYPTDLQLKYEYGKLLFEQGDLTQAIEQFQQARRNPQRRARSNIYIAKAFQQKHQPDLARDHFEAALQDLEPTMNEARKEVLYDLALLCEQQGDQENAEKRLKEIYTADIAYRDVARRVENQKK